MSEKPKYELRKIFEWLIIANIIYMFIFLILMNIYN